MYIRKHTLVLCEKKYGLDMGRIRHLYILYLCGGGVEGNWRQKCWDIVVVSEIQATRGVSFNFTSYN